MSEYPPPDLFGEAIWEDPFPAFARLQEHDPVYPIHQAGMDRHMFVVTRRKTILDILLDPDRFSSQFYEILTGGSSPNPEAAKIYQGGFPEVDVMLTTDPPMHSRFRSLVNKAFMPRRIAAMQVKIEEAADFLIDTFAEKGSCDFIEQFATPLPIYMISDVLGIPRSIHKRFAEWSDAFALRNGQMGTPEDELEAAKLIVECQHYLNGLVQVRKASPGDDMISDIIHGGDSGKERLNDIEVLAVLQQLLIAGNETTRSALIGMMANLLSKPSVLQRVYDDRSLIPAVVEEALRYETPAATTWRIAREDVELEGIQIPAGSVIMARLDAANRDAHQYVDPQSFDIDRSNARTHLTFGQGIHFCVGHVLARRELTIALTRLLERLPDMRVIESESDLRIHTSVQFRLMRALHIGFKPQAVAA